MPPRIPTEDDFANLSPSLEVALHFPSPRESTTAFLVLFHGLGDHEAPFASFAHSINLPGVTAISVRGVAPLPPSMVSDDPAAASEAASHFHWGDDLALDPATGELDDDPGFEAAGRAVMDRLVRETLVERCGWEAADIMLFGFGQGGSLALGLAARLAAGERVVDVSEGQSRRREGDKAFKGVLSIGGPLPLSMVPSSSSGDGAAGGEKSGTRVMVCQLGEAQVDAVKQEFADVKAVRWKRDGVAMPRNEEEVFPMMKFFADCLNNGY